ncbi:MAG: ABC transporter ATP-binding protein [Anaerolineaceae bacterium]|jgi:branched-chain amino acid transport system ATP-binding protein|nr:MAG: ABC transporter ATP-binding protein [Anaerolineaceae bacterium]
MALLQVDNIKTYYGNICALKGVTFEVNQGEIVCLIGSNGAGKTTTLKSVTGLLHPQEGSIIFGGENITLLEPHHIVEKGISMVPEGRHVFSKLSTLENLEMGAYSRKDSNAIQQDIENAFKLFPRLKERSKQSAGTLSGGEQQMLAIARALMAKPKLLLLDEPSMGLAPILLESIFENVKEINAQGTTVLLVEQNTKLALAIADRGYVLQTGLVSLSGTSDDLRSSEMVQKTYLGIA